MVIRDKDLSVVIKTNNTHDSVLLMKLKSSFSSEDLSEWVNYIYCNRTVPVNMLCYDMKKLPKFSKIKMDDIDETMMWIRWVLSQNKAGDKNAAPNK